jgi:hypothetical protein
MKKSNSFLTAVLAVLTVQVAQAVHAQEVLSKTTLSIYGSDISLPTIKNSNGAICKSFVAETKRDGDDLIVKIGKFCGTEVRVSNGIGGFEYYPAGLKAMQVVLQDGQVTHQIPVLN